MSITHTTTIAGTNHAEYDVSATAWNAAHTIGAQAIAMSKLSGTFPNVTAQVGFDSDKDGLTNYWYCDGTADDVQVQLAIDYLSGLGGGSLLLEAGTFDITATIDLPNSTTTYLPDATRLDIGGVGWQTRLDLANGVDDSMFENDDADYAVVGLRMHDMYLRGRASNQTAGSGIGDETAGGEFSQCLFERLYIDDFDEYAIVIDKVAAAGNTHPYENIIRDCQIVSCDAGGIYLKRKAYDQWIGPNNLFYNNAAAADGAALKMWTCVSNYIVNNVFAGAGNTHYGIDILYGRNWFIQGNQFDDIARNAIKCEITGDSEGLIGNGDISHNLFRSCSQEADDTYPVIYCVGDATYDVEYITIYDNHYHNWGKANAPNYLVQFGTNTDNNQVKGFRCTSGDVATGWFADAGTSNLLNQSGKACETLTYTGDGAVSLAVTGLNFRPGAIWIFQDENSDSTAIESYIKGKGYPTGDRAIRFKSTGDEHYQLDDKIISFDIDGFTVDDNGADEHPNKNGQGYFAICWPEI